MKNLLTNIASSSCHLNLYASHIFCNDSMLILSHWNSVFFWCFSKNYFHIFAAQNEFDSMNFARVYRCHLTISLSKTLWSLMMALMLNKRRYINAKSLTINKPKPLQKRMRNSSRRLGIKSRVRVQFKSHRFVDANAAAIQKVCSTLWTQRLSFNNNEPLCSLSLFCSKSFESWNKRFEREKLRWGTSNEKSLSFPTWLCKRISNISGNKPSVGLLDI